VTTYPTMANSKEEITGKKNAFQINPSIVTIQKPIILQKICFLRGITFSIIC
jgi:hypothetical protein